MINFASWLPNENLQFWGKNGKQKILIIMNSSQSPQHLKQDKVFLSMLPLVEADFSEGLTLGFSFFFLTLDPSLEYMWIGPSSL